jgi:hypothetical protein
MKKIVSGLFLGLFTLFALNANAQVKKKPIASKVTITNGKKAEVKETKITTAKKQVGEKTKSALAKKDNSIKIKITTDSGVIIVKLYDSTPLHRDNFVKLVKEKFYDSLLFHRVISGFMI